MAKSTLILVILAVTVLTGCMHPAPIETTIGQGFFYQKAPLEEKINGFLSDVYVVRDSSNQRDIRVVDLDQKKRSLFNQIDNLFAGGSRPLLITFKMYWPTKGYQAHYELLSISFITDKAPLIPTLGPFGF